MKYSVLCSTFSFLYFVNTVYSVSIEPSKPLEFEFKSDFQIHCNVSNVDNKNVTVEWKKGDKLVTELENLKNRITTNHEKGVYTLKIRKSSDNDVGNYSCLVHVEGESPQERSISVSSQIFVKVPSNVNVVEGEKLRIHCQVAGNPKPTLSWMFIPSNGTTNVTLNEDDDRVSLEDDEESGIPNSILTIEDIRMDDRGEYKCIGHPINNGAPVEATSMVRIKDKYAALWPFLGIVAEVVILCAIIFIYEKKHNKAELDESDTDQSPDQKNTPDHGKDSNLRHRQ